MSSHLSKTPPSGISPTNFCQVIRTFKKKKKQPEMNRKFISSSKPPLCWGTMFTICFDDCFRWIIRTPVVTRASDPNPPRHRQHRETHIEDTNFWIRNTSSGQVGLGFKHRVIWNHTLPGSLTLRLWKMGGTGNLIRLPIGFLLPIFRGYVSFREGIPTKQCQMLSLNEQIAPETLALVQVSFLWGSSASWQVC